MMYNISVFMIIYDYHTIGGKNLITSYIDCLPIRLRTIAYKIRESIENDGLYALEMLNTRQIRGKLYEIKFYNQRILFILKNNNEIYFLHICKKEKNRTKSNDINIAINRANMEGLKI